MYIHSSQWADNTENTNFEQIKTSLCEQNTTSILEILKILNCNNTFENSPGNTV